LHARVVDAIERLHTGRLTEHVERLAHHALRGDLKDRQRAICGNQASKAAHAPCTGLEAFSRRCACASPLEGPITSASLWHPLELIGTSSARSRPARSGNSRGSREAGWASE
jgi:hypothetical protein